MPLPLLQKYRCSWSGGGFCIAVGDNKARIKYDATLMMSSTWPLILGARLRGRTATQGSKKGSEKVLGRVLGKGSQKGSEKGVCCGFYSKKGF